MQRGKEKKNTTHKEEKNQSKIGPKLRKMLELVGKKIKAGDYNSIPYIPKSQVETQKTLKRLKMNFQR